MDPDQLVRDQLVRLLLQSNAHMPFEQAIADYPMAHINTVFPNGTYTAWHLLEHLRLSQWDILDFIRNPSYREMEWPKDYWPAPDAHATPEDWQRTVAAFQDDQRALEALIMDPRTDLYAPIPHGDGQTIFREILVVCDHNAYHIGEFAIMRQVMRTWGADH